jgi:hypothetical protein
MAEEKDRKVKPTNKTAKSSDESPIKDQSTASELAREFRWVEVASLAVNGFLAIIGIVALCIYGGQLRVMRGQLDEMAAARRAWVGLMGSDHITGEIVRNRPIKINLDIQNFGKAPALDETSFNALANHPIKDPMPSFEGYSRSDAGPTMTLMPDAIVRIPFSTDKPNNHGQSIILSDADITSINSGQVQLFFYGSIWYNDTLGKAHRTDYCLQYLPPSGPPGPTLPDGTTPSNFAACSTHNYAN